MSDRELLELAARAVGTKSPPIMADDKRGLSWGKGWWNPLTDDGDALRLAIRLRLMIDIDDVGRGSRTRAMNQHVGAEEWHEDSNAEEATRRAIVRAAAIGKGGE